MKRLTGQENRLFKVQNVFDKWKKPKSYAPTEIEIKKMLSDSTNEFYGQRNSAGSGVRVRLMLT